MNRRMTEEFVFIRPMEAPVFCPTAEEFKNPLAYLSKIRPAAEKAGICKIRPPPHWQPPFAVDVDNFRFTPRIQRLNELEAKTRIKLNFLDQIAKYYELSGNSLKIPVLEKKALDLYSLYKLVSAEGGMARVNNDKKWNRLAVRMGYPNSKNYGPLLRSHYEKILLRIEKFETGKKSEFGVNGKKISSPAKSTTSSPGRMSSGEGRMGGGLGGDGSGGRMSGGGMASGSKSRMGGSINESTSSLSNSSKSSPYKTFEELTEDKGMINGNESAPSKELRRLLFYGAGPKMSGYNKQVQDQANQRLGRSIGETETTADPLAKYICQICDGGEAEAEMLICEGCDDSYHIFCLDPPLTSVPPGDWKCSKCVAEDLEKPGEAFGFEQAQREYTLQQFGEMADQFKAEYFNMPVHMVPSVLVEKEFWRIVSAIDEDVCVEYGADLHTMDHGSGFPTGTSLNILPPDAAYINSGWNLNNIPLHPNSVFRHINADISGMKVPWMYVGMCFATFCWHNEDHWSYSINYLHWGEPKTWYGVPGSRADDFENAMKLAAPELFQSQPDLLHQLVTIMNPNILMKAGVPVYRMDQKAGEFIITFPRAYHAGFNQGYNFAEAVNFAPADWLSMGRECITHYSNLHRYCVFSHDELICKMASEPADLDITIAVSCYKDMVTMFEAEKEFRRDVLSLGVTASERVPFELLPDDERICDFCKATCFLSAITCNCTKDRLVCLRHYKELCDCSPDSHILKYRYTLDEIPAMLKKLKTRTEAYETWHKNIQQAMIEQNPDEKLDMDEMKDLLKEVEEKSYPKTPLVEKVVQCIAEAEKYVLIAQKILTPSIKTRNSRLTEESKSKVTVEDLLIFANQLDSLQVKVKETEIVRVLLGKVKNFKTRAEEIIQSKEDLEKSSNEIKELIEIGQSLELDLPELEELTRVMDKMNYLDKMDSLMSRGQTWTIESIAKAIYEGKSFRPNKQVEEIIQELSDLQRKAEEWELTARKKLKEPVLLKDLEELIESSEDINVSLTALSTIKELAKKARDWESSIARYGNDYPFFEELQKIVEKGDLTLVNLPQLNVLKNQLDICKLWKEKSVKLFFKRPYTVTLIEILMPRKIEEVPQRGRKKKFNVDHFPYIQASSLLNITAREVKESKVFEEAYEEASNFEVEKMIDLRKNNLKKSEFPDKATFCVCQGHKREFMLKCELCLERFHPTCIPLPKESEANSTLDSIAAMSQKIALRENKWLCANCCRTRRPDLLKIITFLEEVVDIPVRMLERNAMQCLAKRGVVFRDKAIDLLSDPDIEKVIKTIEESEKLSINSSPQPSKLPIKQEKVDVEEDSKKKIVTLDNDLEAASALILFSHARTETDVKPDIIQNPLKNNAQSTTTETNNNANYFDHPYASSFLSSSGEVKDENKLELKNSNGQHFSLSAEKLGQIDNLLVEGHLIEANIPELHILWKVMEACRSQQSPSMTIEMIKRQIQREIKEKDAPAKRRRTTSNHLKESSESQVPKKPKRKTEAQTKPNIKIKKKSKVEENLEDCAAENCSQPVGENVGWVQCETCELWYHYVCVSVTQEELDSISAYACKACKKSPDSEEVENGKQSECSNKENADNMMLDLQDEEEGK